MADTDTDPSRPRGPGRRVRRTALRDRPRRPRSDHHQPGPRARALRPPADDGGVTPGRAGQRAAGIDARYAQEWLEQQAAAGLIDVTAASADARPATLRALDRRPGVPAPPREPRLGRPALRPPPRGQPRVPGHPRRRLPHRRRHPLRRLRPPRRPRRLQPARLREPAGVGLAAQSPASPTVSSARRRVARRSAAARAGRRSHWPRRSPRSAVDGYDNDDASIAAARKHAAEAGVGDRVTFEVVDVTGDLPARSPRLLRPRHGLRDDPRPRPTRRGARHHAPARQARRRPPRHGREGRRDLRGADRQSRRATHVRGQRPALPARRASRHRPPRPPAPSCAPPPSRATPSAPASRRSTSCRSNTTSSASTTSAADHRRGKRGRRTVALDSHDASVAEAVRSPAAMGRASRKCKVRRSAHSCGVIHIPEENRHVAHLRHFRGRRCCVVCSVRHLGRGAAPPPIDDDVAMPTSRPIGPDDEAAAGTTVPVEVVHVETDTSFGDMGTQGTVLFAETMAPTGSTQRGWWLRMDVTVRNISAQPIEITELGITTDATALAVEALDDPLVVAPGGTALLKPHDVTGSGTPPTWFTVNVLRTGGGAFPCPGQLPARDLQQRHRRQAATGSRRPEHLPAGVFWTPGSFHAHSRGQRYAYDLKAVRWDHDRHEWTRYTEEAFDDEANGIHSARRTSTTWCGVNRSTRWRVAGASRVVAANPTISPAANQRSRRQRHLDRPWKRRVRGVRPPHGEHDAARTLHRRGAGR